MLTGVRDNARREEPFPVGIQGWVWGSLFASLAHVLQYTSRGVIVVNKFCIGRDIKKLVTNGKAVVPATQGHLPLNGSRQWDFHGFL